MGDFFWGVFFVITVIGLSIAGAATLIKYTEGTKECKLNSDCRTNQYCGADFECHDYPTVTQNITSGNDWTVPASILGLAIVISALILRWKR